MDTLDGRKTIMKHFLGLRERYVSVVGTPQ